MSEAHLMVANIHLRQINKGYANDMSEKKDFESLKVSKRTHEQRMHCNWLHDGKELSSQALHSSPQCYDTHQTVQLNEISITAF